MIPHKTDAPDPALRDRAQLQHLLAARLASTLAEKNMHTRKHTANGKEQLKPEYDLALLKGGVRGKYYERAKSGTNLVLIEPEVAEVFPDSEAVNKALRGLIREEKPREVKQRDLTARRDRGARGGRKSSRRVRN